MSLTLKAAMRRTTPHPASFRDPSGFVYRDDAGRLLRQVHASYLPHYRQLMDSGLYEELVAAGSLVAHEEVSLDLAADEEAELVLSPRVLPFVSYPYEWAFSALKDAALLTLKIQQQALAHGMSLKDASAYNVQFDGAKPCFVDTLSFENYQPDRPWAAYGQFCRHFVAPLVLMGQCDISLGRLSALHLDGLPLDLASKLLPWKSWLQLSTLLHIHWHAKSIARHSSTADEASTAAPTAKLSLKQQQTLLSGLSDYLERLTWKPAGTEWADYYENHSYGEESIRNKAIIVEDFLDQVQPQTVWDLGANTGVFSRLASERGADTIAFDIDPACVEQSYRAAKAAGDQRLQSLRLDLTNPSPGLGWNGAERDSLTDRGPVDLVMALALVHHLAIANNTPLDRIAEFLSSCGHSLIIEWVPKGDPQVQRLLRSREDIFHDYNQNAFEFAFARWFDIAGHMSVGNDGRVLYLMHGRYSAED